MPLIAPQPTLRQPILCQQHADFHVLFCRQLGELFVRCIRAVSSILNPGRGGPKSSIARACRQGLTVIPFL